MIHLSITGLNAGQRLCGNYSGESVHAMYAPLDNDCFRAKVCSDCLHVYAHDAYDPDDCKPLWVIEIRSKTFEDGS